MTCSDSPAKILVADGRATSADFAMNLRGSTEVVEGSRDGVAVLRVKTSQRLPGKVNGRGIVPPNLEVTR